jgi:EmrB/QacA subfamily drug resistance transporter
MVLDQTTSGKWWALLGISIADFMFSLDLHIVNIALPTLVESFDTRFATIQWVTLSYMLTLSVFMLVAGRLSDMFSKKPLYLAGIVTFTIASLMCGLAPSVGFLISFRGIQGVGAAFIAAVGVAIITEIFPQQERGRALGIIAGLTSVAISFGPSAGGLLIGLWDWRLVFLVNVPIGIIATWIVVRVVPNEAGRGSLKSFDWVGALLLGIVLTSFAFGMTEGQKQGFGNTTVLIWLTLSAIALVCFLIAEARIEEPMLNLKIFRSLQFSISLLLSWISYITIAGYVFLTPFFLELVKHYPPQQAGLLMAVTAFFCALTSPLAGSLSDQFGTRSVSIIRLMLIALGFFGISKFDTELTSVGWIVGVTPLSLGTAMFTVPNNSAIMGAAPKDLLGIASGLLFLSRTLGHTIGVPLFGALFSLSTITKFSSEIALTNVTTAPVEALVFGLQTTFHIAWLIIVSLVIIAAFVWVLEKTNTRTSEATNR